MAFTQAHKSYYDQFTQAHKSYYDQEYSFKTIVLKLWAIAKTEKRRLLLILFLFLVNTLISIIVPLFLRSGIDEIGADNPNFDLIQGLGFGNLLGTIVLWILSNYSSRMDGYC
ncbi:MAG: hypothetical protein ACTSSO_08305 [Candidatus Hodarchaeales archaeon]